MAYKLKLKNRIDLGYLGEDSEGNSFYVEIKNTKMMTYEEKMQFAKFAPKQDEEFTVEMASGLLEVVGGLVVSWNLISIKDETPVNIPKEDPDAFNKIPSEVVEAIMKGISGKLVELDDDSKNSSAQLDKSLENAQLPETSTSAGITN